MERSASGEADRTLAGQKFVHLYIIWRTVHTVNPITNQHLPLVLPVCPLHQTVCTYHVYSATGSHLLLAMSTQSVDRAADGTHIYCSLLSVICEGINWFDNNIDMGRCKEG
jgi:hypothetical protein